MAIRGPRAAKVNEVEAVVNLANDVFEARRRSMGRLFPTLFRPENARYLRIFTDGARPVALVGACVYEMSLFGCRVGVGNVGSVCTLPDYRGRGLATRLLADMTALLASDGAHIMDISGSRGLYLRAGCAQAGGFLAYGNITAKHAARLVSAAAATPVDCRKRHLEALQGAYQREPVRYLRLMDDAALLAGRVDAAGEGGRLLVLARDGEVVGHLEMRFGERDGVMRGGVNEYAGQRAAIAASLPAVMAHLGLESLDLRVPISDGALIAALRPMGIDPEPAGTGHTYRILNLPGLAQAMGDYIRERIGEQADRLRFEQNGDRCRVRLGRAGVTLDAPQTTRLVLGAPKGSGLPEASRELRAVLRRIFPLPRVLPGLNYV